MTHLFKDRNVYVSAQTQSEWIFFGGRRDCWIRDLGSSLTLQYHPVQFTHLGNFHRAHESLANTLLTLPSSLEVIDLEHLRFYTLKLRIQQDSPGKLRNLSCIFQKAQGTSSLKPSTWQECAISKRAVTFPLTQVTPGSPGDIYCSECFHSKPQASSDVPGGPFQKLQEAALLSNGETGSPLGLWIVNCLHLHGE